MPGIPRSKACAPCKARRSRCDQTWPTCGSCRRNDRYCPGPSSLVKFLNFTPSSVSQVKPSASNSLSNRLKTLLKQDRDHGITQHMRYLHHLPGRLSWHTSLSACTHLFCSAWSDYISGNSFSAFQLYHTALVSIRNTLPIVNDSSPPIVEMLAAMALLERTEALFMQGPGSHHYDAHMGALGELLKRKGPPSNLDDKLDIILTYEIHWLLGKYWAMNDIQSFMVGDIWRDAILHSQEVYWIDIGAKQRDRFETAPIIAAFDQWPVWASKVREFYSGPPSPSSQQFQLDLASAELHLRHITISCSSFTSDPIHFPLLTIRLVMLLMLADLNHFHGLADQYILKEYRELCTTVWALGPPSERMNHINSLPFVELLELSLYATESSQELEAILRAARFIDGYSKRFPCNDNELKQIMTNNLNIMIGRDRLAS